VASLGSTEGCAPRPSATARACTCSPGIRPGRLVQEKRSEARELGKRGEAGGAGGGGAWAGAAFRQTGGRQRLMRSRWCLESAAGRGGG
jgi:hypothetical protein